MKRFILLVAVMGLFMTPTFAQDQKTPPAATHASEGAGVRGKKSPAKKQATKKATDTSKKGTNATTQPQKKA